MTSVIVAVGLVAAMCAGITRAATTFGPTYPGSPPVVRDTAITITTNPVARMFSRSTATGNWTVTAPITAGKGLSSTTPATEAFLEASACRGDNGPFGTSSGAGSVVPRNNSPRTSVKVTGPGGIVALDALSPAIDVSIAGLTTPAASGGPYPELNPQPSGPNNTSYRGGSPAASPNQLTQTRPWITALNLAGKPAGIYTITTTTRNMTKQTSAGLCTIGTAVPGTNAAATPGMQVATQTFEYRPWQHVFTDIFNGGGMNMNVTPKEFQATMTGLIGTIYPGGQWMHMYAVPGAPAAGSIPLLLPSDPVTCAGNPSSCLPPTAIECAEATATCVPRVVMINKQVPGDTVHGFFDLQTHAFIAIVNINGRLRTMMSLGTANDAAYRSLLNQLAAQAAAQGIDLVRLLATTVRLRTGSQELTLSLLNGLQIQPSLAAKGVQIISDATVQAGLILNIYASLGGPVCAATSGDSNPATAAPDRYVHGSDAGYTVEKSDLLPDVPRVGAVGALVGGPIYHIEGDFVGTAPPLVNTSSAVIGVDTAADEPNGYPIWIEPFVSKATHVTAARTMDFIGTATWSASETPVTGVGCLTVDFLLGAGVAIYNNPLDIGFGDIPIWDPQSPAVAALMAQVNAAAQNVATQVGSNPTVAAVIAQVVGALP